MCYTHELNIDDIADSQAYWPTDPADIEAAPPFTENEIATMWIDLFPKQVTSVFSVQLNKCREFLDQHKEMPFSIQIQLLRDYFTEKDRKVLEDGDVYSTHPSKESKAGKSASIANTQVVASRPNANVISASTDSRKRQRDDSKDARPFKSGTGDRSVAPKLKPEIVVPGQKLGIACGSTNDHFGLGCTPTSCVFINTQYQMGNTKNHVWKSSAEEESVRVPDDVYKKLCAARPMVLENLKAAAKRMKEAKIKAGVAALDAGTDYDSDMGQEAADDDAYAAPSDHEHSDASDDDNKVCNYSSCVAALSTVEAASLLAAYGYMYQFLGNLDLLATTTMLPRL
jgi:hypothetical protein